MSKGTLTPVYNKGFDAEYIRTLTDNWEDKPKVDNKKEDVVTQYRMSMEVYELVKESYANHFGDIPTQDVYRKCITFSIKICQKYCKGFDEFSLRKIAQPAYVRFEHCGQQFVNKCVDKFFL